MIRLRKADARLPDYIFTEIYDTFFVFEVGVVAEGTTFIKCLQSFVKLLGEENFYIKHAGELDISTQGYQPLHIYFEQYELAFCVEDDPHSVMNRMDLAKPYREYTLYYLDFIWDGVIEGDSSAWVLHFERPADLAIFAMKKECKKVFEATFLKSETMRQRHVTNLRDIQIWGTMRDETQFQTFIRNYFPADIQKYQKQ